LSCYPYEQLQKRFDAAQKKLDETHDDDIAGQSEALGEINQILYDSAALAREHEVI
jgi:hypothetical protein